MKINNNLSVLIITYNEVENIDAIIANISFADEIIIIDSYSSDGTAEAIKKHENVKLIQRKFSNFSDQRNFALKQVTYNWVLFIDADERISTNLKHEIVETLNKEENIVAYCCYRNFYFKDNLVRFSGYQTNKVFRLFNKKYVIYDTQKLVHETLNIDGKTKILKHKLDHYSYESYNGYKAKLLKYAKLRAKELYLSKIKPNFYHFYVKTAYRFFYHFIIRLGFLDGKKGFLLSKLNAFEVQQRYVELKKLHRSKEK